MPRPSEWFVSPPSQTQSSTSQTKSEVLQRPNVRPQSVIAASPSPDSQPIRVSALPISQSRKSRASLESVVQYPVARPSSVSIPSRPRIPQRSVSAHPNVFNRPVKDVAEVEPEARHNVSQDVYMQLPASARSDPIPGGSAEMGRAKSAPGEVAASPVKARPRSLTLTAQNPADLDSMFKEFIVGPDIL